MPYLGQTSAFADEFPRGRRSAHHLQRQPQDRVHVP